jgi:hypothetical protein
MPLRWFSLPALAEARRRQWEEQVLREVAMDTVGPAGPAAAAVRPGVTGRQYPTARRNGARQPALAVHRAFLRGARCGTCRGAFGVITSDVWRLAAAMSWWRLALLSLISVAATIVAISAHGLWERATDDRVREQVVPSTSRALPR